ncbi:MAG: response regulator transcription factor [Lutisporaceae bacterium]
MDNTNIRILVVDDEEKIVEVIKSYLQKENFQVYTAYNGKQALELYNDISPDLVILDLMLPDICGEDVCRRIRNIADTPIIMLTAKVEEVDILNGLNIGADDYVIKPFSPKQLIARINAVLRRTVGTADIENLLIFNNGELVINKENHVIKKSGKPVNLTPVEYEILLRLVKYPKKIFTRDELIAFVLGEDYEGYDRTIDTHIKNLRQKLESNSREPHYILTVYGVGYRFGGE